MSTQVDLNTTRVSARLTLIVSIIRMDKLLRVYGAANPCPVSELHDLEYTTLTEIEAIMRISGTVATMVQAEQHFVAALCLPLHQRMLNEFRASRQRVIDLDRVGPSPHLVRVDKPALSLTALGKECLRRATLEVERRYTGNTTEVLTGKEV